MRGIPPRRVNGKHTRASKLHTYACRVWLAVGTVAILELGTSYRIHAPGVHIDEEDGGDDNPGEPTVRAD